MMTYGPVKPCNMVLMAQDDGEELSTTHSDSDGTLSEDDCASDDVECEDVLQSEGALEYEAPVAGRSLGVQPIPQFDIDQLRPFESCFATTRIMTQLFEGAQIMHLCSLTSSRVPNSRSTKPRRLKRGFPFHE